MIFMDFIRLRRPPHSPPNKANGLQCSKMQVPLALFGGEWGGDGAAGDLFWITKWTIEIIVDKNVTCRWFSWKSSKTVIRINKFEKMCHFVLWSMYWNQRKVSKRIPRLATLVGAYGAGFVFQLCWFQYSSNFLDKRNIEPKTIGNLLQTRIAYRMYACRYAYIYAYICIYTHICAYIRVYEYIQDGRHDEAYHRCLSFIWIFSWF